MGGLGRQVQEIKRGNGPRQHQVGVVNLIACGQRVGDHQARLAPPKGGDFQHNEQPFTDSRPIPLGRLSIKRIGGAGDGIAIAARHDRIGRHAKSGQRDGGIWPLVCHHDRISQVGVQHFNQGFHSRCAIKADAGIPIAFDDGMGRQQRPCRLLR